MGRYLALDWDRLETRMVVARTHGETIQIERIATAPLDLDPQESSLADIERQLSQAIEKQRFPRCQALTAIGRSLVELRVLQLPPAPDEELPELVRFQALREFSALGEDSPLDFVRIKSSGDSGDVMAASISTELAAQVRGALTAAGQEATRAILRPCATTSLAMRRCERARSGVTLVITQLADAAELAVAQDGTVVFTRSFRLPPGWHPGTSGQPLLGEVRRSIAAAQNQLGSRVDHIVVFGTSSEHDGICQRLREHTDLDVELLDPFQSVEVASERPATPERFAATIGMLCDEVADVRPAIDFFNPRRKPVPESKARQYTLIGAATAVLLLVIVGLVFWQFHKLNQQLAELRDAHNQIEAENERLKPSVDIANELDAWKEGDRNWLEEFRRLSGLESLTPEDFLVESLDAVALAGNQGQITVTGRAKDQQARSTLLAELRDDTHEVEVRDSAATEGDARYPLEFITVIRTSEAMPVVPSTPDDEAVNTENKNQPADQQAAQARDDVASDDEAQGRNK